MTEEIEQEEQEEKPKKKKIDKRVVKIMYTKGQTAREIAEHFGTSTQYIKNIIYNDRKSKAEEEAAPKKKPGRPPGSKNVRTLAEEKMLANWENTKLAPMMREDKAELNRAAGWFVAQCWQMGQTIDKNNIESLYNGLMRYVELCTKTGMPMLVKTAHLALGINAQTIAKWRNGTQRGGDPRYKEFAEMLDMVINAGIESAAAAGSIDRVLTIWWQKAHFNMTEGNGVAADLVDPLGQRLTAKEIAQKYENLPD